MIPTARLLLGVLVGLLILPAGLYLYVASGHAPVATADASMPMEAFLPRWAENPESKRSNRSAIFRRFNPADLEAGADIYQKDCAFCHGLPNQPKPDAAKGMFPHAPQLLDKDDMVTDDPVGESFWKVKNGIRLSGMPSFKDTLSENQIWQVSALLARADQLPPEVSVKLKGRSE